MRFMVRVFRQGTDYSAMVPDLPGCVAAGDSVEEVLELIAETADMHLEMLRRSGERIPIPTKQLVVELQDLEEGEICAWIETKGPKNAPRRKKPA